MLIAAFEIICAIFTVYGMYTFIQDVVDILAVVVRRRENKRNENQNRKESNHVADTDGHDDG